MLAKALPLVGAEAPYKKAAQICGTNLSMIKSRINRARTRLAEILALEAEVDLRGAWEPRLLHGLAPLS